MSEPTGTPEPSFSDLGLPAPLLKALNDVGYETPSPPSSASAAALRCARRPPIATFAPASRYAKASVRPIPLLPPVTKATRPASENALDAIARA